MTGEREIFSGKTVVVTGGAGGIGAACAVSFAEQGATVIVADVAPTDEVIERCAATPGAAVGVDADVTDPDAVEALVGAAIDRGGIDALVNNAGTVSRASLFDLDPDEWARTIDLNLSAVYAVSRAAAPSLVERNGAIVNVSSVFSQLGRADRVAYCASKAGVDGLTRSMAADFGPKGVRVNAVNPGFVETPMTAVHLEDGDAADAFAAGSPLGILGAPRDVAEAVCFLASDRARFITGETLLIDGGRALIET
ncbi:SDR family NAD(P)-dependent oxidoreductase [Haloferacaceae archaeon DSL9]